MLLSPVSDPVLLRGVVEPGDRLIRGCREHDGFAVDPGISPGAEGVAFHAGGGAAMEPTFEVIDIGDSRVASPKLKRCLAFPVVGEAVDLVEFDRAVGVDEVFKHATTANG